MTLTSDECDVDVVIVGGGMVGASLALVLAKHLPGVSLKVIDRSEFDVSTDDTGLLSFDRRSTALSPTSVKIFKQLNLWSDLERYAAPINEVQVSDSGQLGWTRLNRKHNSDSPLGYVVDNYHMGLTLTSAVRGIKNIAVRECTEVTSVKPVGGGVMVSLNNDAALKARLLVIADGAESQLGQKLGVRQNVKDYQQCAIVANVRFEQSHQGVAFERFTEQGPLALLPLPSDGGLTASLVWTWPSAKVEAILSSPESEFLRLLNQSFGFRLGNFVSVSKCASYPLALTLAQEQVRSNIVLMGNSAHFLHPVAGQGFNLSARDAWALGDVLAKSSLPLGNLSVLLEYQAARELDQFNTVKLSDGFTQVFGSRAVPAKVARTAAMLGIEHFSVLRGLFIEQMSGRAALSI